MCADKGHVEAQRNYGICLKKGDGVIRNLSKSQYFKMASDQEFPEAQFIHRSCLQMVKACNIAFGRTLVIIEGPLITGFRTLSGIARSALTTEKASSMTHPKQLVITKCLENVALR